MWRLKLYMYTRDELAIFKDWITKVWTICIVRRGSLSENWKWAKSERLMRASSSYGIKVQLIWSSRQIRAKGAAWWILRAFRRPAFTRWTACKAKLRTTSPPTAPVSGWAGAVVDCDRISSIRVSVVAIQCTYQLPPAKASPPNYTQQT